MRIRQALKRRIKELCFLSKLCNMSGITHSDINSLLNKPNSDTKVSTIQKICDSLDISIQDFFILTYLKT